MAEDQTEEKKKQTSEKEGSNDFSLLPTLDAKVDLGKALLGGLLAALVTVTGAWAVGQVHGGEGRVLLQAMLPTTRFLCSAVVTSSATILALMLTLLSLSTNASDRMHPAHYKRVRQIALIDTVAFVAAILLLLVLNIPLEESDNVSAKWFGIIYYIVLGFSSLLCGVLISVVLMLYDTIRDLIHVIGLDEKDHPMHKGEPAEDEKEKDQADDTA